MVTAERGILNDDGCKFNISTEVYRNPLEAVLTVERREVNKYWSGRERSSDQSSEWGAVRSLAEAVSKSHEGYVEVTEEMKDTFASAKKYIFQRVKPRQVRPENAYVGSTPNVARAILGLPKDMRHVHTEDRKVPGIHLVYEVGLCCRYKDKELVEYGARMLALVSVCIRQGIPIKLSITDSMNGLMKRNGDILSFRIGVKDYSDTSNIRKIAYWLAHPSMHRRLMFALLETTPLAESYDDGYGYPIANSKHRCETVRKYYRDRGEFWFSPCDFASDEDILKAWRLITGDEE